MAIEKWRPGKSEAEGKADLPKRKTDLNHSTIEEWIDLYGTEEDKKWFVAAADKHQKEVVFYKWDEKELRKDFLAHLGVIAEGEEPKAEDTPSKKPSERLAKKYGVKTKK